jgi:serine/threonine protein kinase
MGTVYEAVDTALDRSVAVKVIREDLVGSPVAAERFRQEARAAASFTHPNVVTVYDFGVAANARAFLIMELLEGVTLREELRTHARLTASRTLEILRCVCAAVDAAHRRQMVHRDLKPENIFLARAETGESPKVLDFGLAKFLPSSAEQTLDTDPGALVGTVRYMAPEQLCGQQVHPAWDLWALSVMAYEMLTGAQPFIGSTTVECCSSISAGNFTPVNRYLPDSPSRWQEFFVHAFALDANRRPTPARIYLSDLERALS